MFFENLLDKMVEEVFHSDLFDYQNVSLFDKIDLLEDLSCIADDQLNERVDCVYNEIIKDIPILRKVESRWSLRNIFLSGKS